MPHQGLVALCISAFSLLITLGLLTYCLGSEKRNRAGNEDKH